MAIKFTNNATATLAASISTSSTSLTVTTSQGALFPTLAAGDYFYATLTDSSNNLEIVKITARSGDTLTATRAQEGTTARTYAAADKLELRVTAATLTNFATQDGVNTFAAANTFSGNISSSGSNTFSSANNFTGSVTFTNVPTFSGGALPVANGGTGVTTAAAITALVGNLLYPVGSIYSNASNATNPGTLLGFGTWTAAGVGRVLIGVGSLGGNNFTAGASGGAFDAALPAHTHTISDPGHAHTSYVPYSSAMAPGATGFFASAKNAPDYSQATSTASTGITGTNSAGVSPTNANLPPYTVVYMWQRTA
jgi:hypothetical protein